MPRRAAVKAVVPLTALALVGLTACQKSDDADSKPSASASADAGQNSADKSPASDDQLSAVLLDGKDVPTGYTAGQIKTERDDKSDMTADPAECGALNGLGGADPVGHAERSYATGGKDPESDDSVRVSVNSAPHDQLKAQFDAAMAALKNKKCSTYQLVQGSTTVSTTVVEVKNAPFGKDSVTYKVTLTGPDNRSLAIAVNTIVLKGTTGLAVSSFATPGMGDPADTAPWVTAQLAKLDALASGGASGKPKAPSGKPSGTAAPSNGKNQPTSDQLSGALLNKQEITADLSMGETSTTRPTDEPTQVSDTRCAPLTKSSVESSATGYAEATYMKAAAGGGTPTEGVITSLASQSHPFLKQEFDNYVTALKACPAFTETKADGSVEKYTVTDVTVGNYGTDSVAFRLRADSPKDGRLYAFIVLSVQGTVSTQMTAFATNGPAAEPTNMITGQLEKVAELTR